jgi:hypothetical protein
MTCRQHPLKNWTKNLKYRSNNILKNSRGERSTAAEQAIEYFSHTVLRSMRRDKETNPFIFIYKVIFSIKILLEKPN